MEPTHAHDEGYTLVEMLAVIGIVCIAAGAAVPTGLARVEEARLDGAARHMATLSFTARAQAVLRSRSVALRFEPDPGSADIAFRLYVDGNNNGVRTLDIANGIDQPLSPREHLPDRFPGTRFGIAAGLIGIDPGDVLNAGDDPIRVGPSNLVSFSPSGSVTPGTLYIRSDRGQRAIRFLGATGRTRVLSFWFPEHSWTEE
jgi:prepilin-type N-terminal cleavage/methylation domain-containing protein